MRLFILDEAGTYRAAAPAEIVAAAKVSISGLYRPGKKIDHHCLAKDLFFIRLAEREQEVFAVLFLDNKHRVIQYEELFFGTIDSSAVHPRQVVKRALHHNAAAVILGHNHPSGELEPSRGDELITNRLKEVLAMIDVRVLDHVIVGRSGATSFGERGLI